MSSTTELAPGGDARDTRNLLIGNGCMLLSTIFFGFDFPFIKIIVPSAVSGGDITVFRVVGACVLFWILSMFLKCQPLQKSDAWRMLAGGGLSLFGFIELFNLAVAYGNPVDISVVMTLPPIFVALAGVFFMHARVGWLEILGLLLGLAAAVVVIIGGTRGHEGSDNMLGIIFGLCSCLCYAFYLIIMAKPLKKYSSISALRWTFLAACVPCIFLLFDFVKAPLFHGTAPHVGAAWGCIAFIVLAPTFLSYLLMNKSISLIGSELTGLYQYFLPVAAVIASLIMGVIHVVRADQIVAMIVVVVGMVLTTLGKRRSTRKAAAAAAVSSK